MASRKRVKREVPARRGPIRNKAVPMPADVPRTSASGLTVGAIVDEGVKTAMRAVEAADATVRGAVERGVDTAYMVIEEYMLRGRQAAGRNHERRNGRTEMNEGQNGGGSGNNYSGNGFGGGAWGPMNPMMAPWMQLMRMWSENMSALIPGGGGIATDWMTQMMSANPFMAPAPASRTTVSVHVASPAPVAVKADIDPGAMWSKLTAEPLTRHDNKSAPLTVALVCKPGDVRVELSVAAGQPTGHYVGAVHDASGVKRGEIIVDVETTRATTSRAKTAAKRSRKTRTTK
ncbi:MAG: hypothetical protein ABJE10_23020 [bacterium]